MEKMVIAGAGSRYMTSLYEYFLSNHGAEFEIILFTDIEALKCYASEHYIKVLITEESFVEGIELRNVNTRICLTEEREEAKEDYLFKFTSCENIYKQAMAMCAAKTAADEVKEFSGSKQIIGVYTPIRRCLQTTFSITAGQILARTKRTLYLNFESFSGFDSLCSTSLRTDIMDLVYYSECDNENFMYRVSSMKDSIGFLDYISPVKSFAKLHEVTVKQWEKLLDNLLERTDYEVIILDLSEQVNGLLDILKKCNRIYTIVDSDRIATAKIIQYENLLRETAHAEVIDRTQNIHLPKFRDIPSRFEMLPYSELAEYVKKLLECDSGEDNDRL